MTKKRSWNISLSQTKMKEVMLLHSRRKKVINILLSYKEHIWFLEYQWQVHINKSFWVIATLVIILDINPWIANHIKSFISVRRIHPNSRKITWKIILVIKTLLILLRWKIWEDMQFKISITKIKYFIKWHSLDIVIVLLGIISVLCKGETYFLLSSLLIGILSATT